MSYTGLYINLDRSTERRAAMEAELARHDLASVYTRFPAADGNALNLPNPNNLRPGILGCFTSHYLALKQHAGSEKHLHVIEDDAVFARCAPQVIRWAIDTGRLDRCDILYTDVSIPVRSDSYKIYRTMFANMAALDAAGNLARANFDAFDLKDITYASTTSMLVNRNAIPKLIALYEEEAARGLALPVDLFLRTKFLEGKLKIGCLFPFVTSLSFDTVFSSIDTASEMDVPTALTRFLGRYCFFVDCDWNKCREYVRKFMPLPDDPQARLLADVMLFSLTDAYRTLR